MSEYLLEAYCSPHDRLNHGARPDDIATAADQLTREGRPVRLVRIIFTPEDESCFYLFEALCDEDVSEAASRSGLRYQRLVEAVSLVAIPAEDRTREVSPRMGETGLGAAQRAPDGAAR